MLISSSVVLPAVGSIVHSALTLLISVALETESADAETVLRYVTTLLQGRS